MTDRQTIVDAVMDVIYPRRTNLVHGGEFRAAIFDWDHNQAPRESELLELAGRIADRVDALEGEHVKDVYRLTFAPDAVYRLYDPLEVRRRRYRPEENPRMKETSHIADWTVHRSGPETSVAISATVGDAILSGSGSATRRLDAVDDPRIGEAWALARALRMLASKLEERAEGWTPRASGFEVGKRYTFTEDIYEVIYVDRDGDAVATVFDSECTPYGKSTTLEARNFRYAKEVTE